MNHTYRIEAILAVEGMREEVDKYITEKGYERGSHAENMELDREYPGLAMGYGLDMDYVLGEMIEDRGEIVFSFMIEKKSSPLTDVTVYLFLGNYFHLCERLYDVFGNSCIDGSYTVGYPQDDLKLLIEDIFYQLKLCNTKDYFFPNNYVPCIDSFGKIETEFLLNFCLNHTKIGSVIEVNQEKFKRTEQGFEAINHK
jgi:hypothetical protein